MLITLNIYTQQAVHLSSQLSRSRARISQRDAEQIVEQVGRRRQGNRADRQSLEVKVDLKVSVAQKESPEASDDNRLALGLISLQRIKQKRLRLVSFHCCSARCRACCFRDWPPHLFQRT